jgi:hypothetical protein
MRKVCFVHFDERKLTLLVLVKAHHNAYEYNTKMDRIIYGYFTMI